jgi:hypothetical protein
MNITVGTFNLSNIFTVSTFLEISTKFILADQLTA